jgi:DNA polymerase (family X)
LRNFEVADLLDRLGNLVEANGEDRFKVIAYHRAATSIRNLGEDVEEVARAGRLEEIQYVGSGIARKIDEYLRECRLRLLDDLAAKTPPGVPLLMKVQGVGPRTAYKLARGFGIASVSELRAAIESGRLDEEFGEGTRKSLLEAIQKMQSYEKRLLLPEAEGRFGGLSAYFEAIGIGVSMAGSLRRGKSTIGDLDLLSTDKGAVEALAGCPGVATVLESGPKRASVKLEDGVQVDVRVFDEEEYGAAMVYFTGSKDHNVALRNLAIEKGMKLNEYGLFEAEGGRRVAGKSEEQVYRSLGMQFVPPELRENRGEVEAAVVGKLPALVKMDDIKGDLQTHSTWSDGRNELEAMARAGMERGYEYMAFTDHSVSVRVANGLTEERFRRQWKEIDAVNDRLAPFRVLKGVELEIRADGSMDFEKKFLEGFDVVGASLHQSFRQSPEKLTARAVAALQHPSVDFLCHPTNRLLGRREPNPIDLDEVIRVAKDNGKMLEIDGQPRRLDLDETWARRAMEEGVTLLVDSDAHSTGELDSLGYGVTVARRGWLEAKHVANTRDLEGLLRLTA